ncbi:MAG: beta-galactosidase [Deltaproteobacteria bacterium]|nr:beta-galactosidase [Deltaproteobacteria bacterium]MBW2394303.1 beta-galactosidase [Deltaproteobacteria bacterium]
MKPLRTRWADDVDPDLPLPEYPRPQLRRERWTNLNGRWDLAIQPREASAPASFDQEILVPFPVGSALSGVQQTVGPEERIWLHRSFATPALGERERLRLHFGAVDWEAEVWCNDQRVGLHQGGFDPFFFDITDALVAADEQGLVVAIWDPTDAGTQPLGKQIREPFGIQYTAVSGIWQTVWLEPVPDRCIERIVAETKLDLDAVTVRVRTSCTEAEYQVEIAVRAAGVTLARTTAAVVDGEAVAELQLPGLHPWSPEDPFLHDLEIHLLRGDARLDHVESYFGAREVAVDRDADGYWRLFLNGEPIFHLGPLDQGWWPDGLYTAPTDEALAFDIEATKRMGFNTIRKHVKVEPARWYWHADRLGVLVWQDMPNLPFDLRWFLRELGKGQRPEQVPFDFTRPDEVAKTYRRELDAMLDSLAPFACIVVWVPFNEAWGQHDTDAILAHVARRDPTRLVDGPSGWTDTGTGAIRDHHVYNAEKDLPPLEPDRPLVYGEFGGLKLHVEEHVVVEEGWGYAEAETPEALAEAYEELMEVIGGLVERGLAGAIYTQTTDVEGELNGLLTYDRAVFKISPQRLAAAHRGILGRLLNRSNPRRPSS